MKIKMSYEFSLTPEEFSLVTKSLTRNLSDKDIKPAKELGLKLMQIKCDELRIKLSAADHALEMARQ